MYSEQAFAFAEFNHRAIADLLARAKSDGGGNSFYNGGSDGHAGTRLWGKVTGERLSADSTANSPHFRAEGGSLQAGIDLASDPSLRLGVAIGYGDDTLRYSDGSRTHETIVRGSVYGSGTLGGIGVSAVLDYAHGSTRTSRQTGIGPESARLHPDEITGAFQVSRPFATGGFVLTPAAGLELSRLKTGAFTERAALPTAFAITGRSTRKTLASPFAEFGISRDYALAGGAVLTPDVQIGYRYNDSAKRLGVTLVAADGTVFTGNSARLDAGAAIVHAGLTAHSGRWTGFVRYDADFAGNWRDQAVEGGLRIAF